MANIDKDDLFGSFLPKPYIEKVSLSNNKVVVKVVIKQNFQNAENSNLLEKLGLLDHFIVKVFEVQDGRISSLINFSKDFLFSLDGKGPVNLNVAKFASNYLQELNPYLVKKIMQDSCIIKSSRYRTEKEEGFEEKDIDVLDDGTQVHSKYFSFSFEHDIGVNNVGHLSYYAIVQLDDEFFIKNNITDIEIKKSYRSLIEVQGENIINDFELTGESFVYLDENSKIWTGDVYEKEEEYYTGFWDGRIGTEPKNSKRVIKRVIRNNIIEDIRKREIVDKTSYNIRNYENYIPKFSSTNSGVDYRFFKKPEVYLSNFNIDSVDQNLCRGSFLFHLNKFIKENNIYMKYTNPDIVFFNQLDISTIKNIKISRKRVLKRYSNNEEIIIPFRNNEVYYPIINIAKFNSTNYFKAENKNCIISLTKNDTYQGINIEFIDKQVSKFSDGFYQYSIEIETKDPSYEFVKTQMNLLRQQYSNLQMYYNNSQQPNSFNFEQNKFTKNFNNEINQEYIINAITIFSQVRENLGLEEDEEFILKISNMTSPAIGTPEGILVFKTIIENYIKNLEILLGETDKSLSDQSITFRKNRVGLLFSHTFKNTLWDSNRNTITYDYGIDKEMKSSDFLNLVFQHINEDSTNEEKQAQIPYVSPVLLSKMRTNVRIGTEPRNVSRKLLSIKNDKTEKDENSDLKQAFRDLSRNFNISIEEYQIQKKEEIKATEQIINIPKTKRSDFSSSGNKLERASSKYEFNAENDMIYKQKPFFVNLIGVFSEIPSEKKEAPTKPGTAFKPPKISKLNKGKNDTKEAIKNKLKESTIFTDEEKSKIPPHIKNMLEENNQKNSKNRNTPDKNNNNLLEVKNLNKINIGATKKVEILTGFEKNIEGKVDPKKPKWETISVDNLNKFSNGDQVSCRIVDFKEPKINIEDPTKGQKIKNSSFSIIVENSKVKEIEKPKIEISSGITKNSSNLKVEKEKYEKILQNNFEQTKYPPEVCKTLEVSKKTVSEAISEPKVLKEAQKQVEEKNKISNKGIDKVGPQAAAATKSKNKKSKSGKAKGK